MNHIINEYFRSSNLENIEMNYSIINGNNILAFYVYVIQIHRHSDPHFACVMYCYKHVFFVSYKLYFF